MLRGREGIRYVRSVEPGNTSSSGSDLEDVNWREHSSGSADTDTDDTSPESDSPSSGESDSLSSSETHSLSSSESDSVTHRRTTTLDLRRRSERRAKASEPKLKFEPVKTGPGVEAAKFVVSEIIDPWLPEKAQREPSLKTKRGFDAATHVVTVVLDSWGTEKTEHEYDENANDQSANDENANDENANDENANAVPSEARLETVVDRVRGQRAGVSEEQDYINEDGEGDSIIPSYPPNLLARRITTSPLDPDTQQLPIHPPEELPGPSRRPAVPHVRSSRKTFNKRGDMSVVLPKALLENRRTTSPVDPVAPMRPRGVSESRLRKPKGNKVGPAPRSNKEDVVIDIDVRPPSPEPDFTKDWYDMKYTGPKFHSKLTADEMLFTSRSNPECQGDGHCDMCFTVDLSDSSDPEKDEVDYSFMYQGYKERTDNAILASVGFRPRRNLHAAQDIHERISHRKDMQVVGAFRREVQTHMQSLGIVDMMYKAEKFVCMSICVPAVVFLWTQVLHLPGLLQRLDVLWGKIAAQFLGPNDEDILEKVYVDEDKVDTLGGSYVVEVESESDEGFRVEDYPEDSFPAYCFKTMGPERFKIFEKDVIAHYNGTRPLSDSATTDSPAQMDD